MKRYLPLLLLASGFAHATSNLGTDWGSFRLVSDYSVHEPDYAKSLFLTSDGIIYTITTHEWLKSYDIVHHGIEDELVSKVKSYTDLSINSIAISPDNKHLYFLADIVNQETNNRGVYSANLNTSNNNITNMTEEVEFHDIETSITISPDGKFVYSGTYDGTSGFINWYSVNPIDGHLTYYGHVHLSDGQYAIAISPDGLTAYSGTSGGYINQYQRNPDTGALTFIRNLNVTDAVQSITVSPDGHRIFTTNWEGYVNWYDIYQDGTFSHTGYHDHSYGGYVPMGVAVSKDNLHVYISDSGQNVTSYHMAAWSYSAKWHGSK